MNFITNPWTRIGTSNYFMTVVNDMTEGNVEARTNELLRVKNVDYPTLYDPDNFIIVAHLITDANVLNKIYLVKKQIDSEPGLMASAFPDNNPSQEFYTEDKYIKNFTKIPKRDIAKRFVRSMDGFLRLGKYTFSTYIETLESNCYDKDSYRVIRCDVKKNGKSHPTPRGSSNWDKEDVIALINDLLFKKGYEPS